MRFLKRWAWTAVPLLSLGMLSWAAFAIRGAAARSLQLIISSVLYGSGIVAFAIFQAPEGEPRPWYSYALIFGTWIGSSIHAFTWSALHGDRPAASTVVQPVAAPQPAALDGNATIPRLNDLAWRVEAARRQQRGFGYPPEIFDRLAALIRSTATLVTSPERLALPPESQIALQLAAEDYVPSAVLSVLAVDEDTVARSNGAATETARSIVATLQQEIDSTGRATRDGDLAQLRVQQRFLRDRFGEGGLRL